MDFHLALPRWLADQRLDKEAKLKGINNQNKQQLRLALDGDFLMYFVFFTLIAWHPSQWFSVGLTIWQIVLILVTISSVTMQCTKRSSAETVCSIYKTHVFNIIWSNKQHSCNINSAPQIMHLMLRKSLHFSYLYIEFVFLCISLGDNIPLLWRRVQHHSKVIF